MNVQHALFKTCVHECGHVTSHPVTFWPGRRAATSGSRVWEAVTLAEVVGDVAAAAAAAGTLLASRRPWVKDPHASSASPSYWRSPWGTYNGTATCIACMLVNIAVNLVTHAHHVLAYSGGLLCELY